MRRRRILASTGGLIVSGFAGCVAAPNGEPTDTTSVGTAPRTTTDRRSITTPIDVAGTWPQVTYDSQNTRYTPDARGPRENPVIAWRSVGDRPVYPPVLKDDLFLTEAWTHGAAFSLGADDGERRWRNTDLPPIRWAPALVGDQVFVITREEGNVVRLHALDQASGEETWVRESGIRATSGEHPPIGPSVREGVLYLAWHRGVIAIEASTGETHWAAELGPHVVETDDGPTWRTDWAKPAVTANRVFTFDTNDSYEETRRVYAVNRSNGDREWTAELDAGEDWYLRGYVVAGTDLLFVTANKPSIYVGGEAARVGDGRVYALDPVTGDVVWDWQQADRTLSTPAYAHDQLYLTEHDPDADIQRVHALAASDGDTLWTNRADNAFSIPTVAGDTVFISHGDVLEAVDTAHGTRRWRVDLGATAGWPAIVGDTAFIQTNPGHNSKSEVLAITDA